MKKKEWSNDETYQYYKKTAEEIKKMWNDNANIQSSAGTKLHNNIEYYYNQIPVENDSIEYQFFLKFVKDFPNLEPYRSEWCIYDEELKLSGSIDMIFRDKETGEFLVYDWKRSKEIKFESYGKKTSHVSCISHLPDCNFWHYSLQLNTYRYILEKNYGLKISGMFLVVFHPNNSLESYDRIEVHDLTKEINDVFEFRKKLLRGEVTIKGH
jgi:ATP-dependent exoDNAse (exonuclease V) beta subunit